jgi:hypothetical protein
MLAMFGGAAAVGSAGVSERDGKYALQVASLERPSPQTAVHDDNRRGSQDFDSFT